MLENSKIIESLLRDNYVTPNNYAYCIFKTIKFWSKNMFARKLDICNFKV